MNDPKAQLSSKAMQRRPIQTGALVREHALDPASPLPLVIEATTRAVDLCAWAGTRRAELEQKLFEHGALLFRGFGIDRVEPFERLIGQLSSGALEYQFRASPRTRLGGNIYTSTDYPADQRIFPHNEHSYSPRFPLRLFFGCSQPAAEGGETPIGSTRAVMARIPAEIQTRFKRRKILYVRNYGDGFGLPWQTVFQTHDRAEVERYCSSVGIEAEWKDGDRLRTRQIGEALIRHPYTREWIWFNHATFFHVSTLPETISRGLQHSFGPFDLPTNTFYGDGAAIERGPARERRILQCHSLLA